MKSAVWSIVALAAVVLVPSIAAGQAPHDLQGLLKHIKQAKAVHVDPAVIKAPGTAVTAPAKPVAQVPRGQLLFVPLEPDAERVAEGALAQQVAAMEPARRNGLQVFPGAVRQLGVNGEEVQLKPYVLVGQPLQYVPERDQFVGTIVVGVADLQDAGGARALTVPLEFEVLESALAKPSRVSLDETSPPYQRIEVTSKVVGRPVTLHIASNFSHEGVEVSVPIEPTLLVDIDGDHLRGFGMQTAAVTVTAIGGARPGTGEVNVLAPGAFIVNGSPLTFDESGIARAVLRTDRTGPLTVTATASGFVSGSRMITVIWPWPTLLAASLGGLLGGFVRLGPRIRKRMNIVRFLVGLVISVFVGVIVFALYVVGVKLLPVQFTVEVGDIFAFATAALAGWLGSSVLTGRAALSDAK
jgi:hypothetical protein